MTTVIEAIIKAKFLATEEQVETLAGIVAQGQAAEGTYLSVLVACSQAELAGKRKPSKDTQLAAINTVHERFYPAALRGVGPEDMTDEVRNAKGVRFRTSASDLRHYVKMGGDLRALDAAAVTKAQLRAEGKTVPTGTRAERSLTKAHDALFRGLQRLARRDVSTARERILEMQGELEKLLESIGRPAAVTRKHGRRTAEHRAAH